MAEKVEKVEELELAVKLQEADKLRRQAWYTAEQNLGALRIDERVEVQVSAPGAADQLYLAWAKVGTLPWGICLVRVHEIVHYPQWTGDLIAAMAKHLPHLRNKMMTAAKAKLDKTKEALKYFQ